MDIVSKKSKCLGDQFYGFLLSAPGVLLVIIFTVFPFILNVLISFTGYTLIVPDLSFIGLRNYREVLRDGVLLDTTRRTLIWTVGNFIPVFVLGILASLVMNSDIRGINILRALILLPWILPEVVTGYTFQWMLSGDYGIIWTYLVRSGIVSPDFTFFADARGAMFAVILGNTWRGFDFVAVMTYAKLRTLPTEQVEAALIEGANVVQRFIHITIPWVFPVLQRCAFLIFVWTFNAFSIIHAMTRGGPGNATETFPVMIQRIAFRVFDFGRATTLGTVSALIIILILVFVFIIGGIVRKRRTLLHG
jgi:multiple sugar transport system permease protein